MHQVADHLHLSPSDVTAFLACEHLTTLSLAHARGEVVRPEVADEQRDLIFRKGLEHEHAHLETHPVEGRSTSTPLHRAWRCAGPKWPVDAAWGRKYHRSDRKEPCDERER